MKEEYGEIGSGYPADPVTIGFLTGYIRDHMATPPPIATEELGYREKPDAIRQGRRNSSDPSGCSFTG